MAVGATLLLDGGHFRLDLYPGELRERVADDPPELPRFHPGSTTWVYYDGLALECGRHEPVGIEVVNVADLTDADLVQLERLTFPSMAVRGVDSRGASLGTLLRWARAAQRARRRDTRTEASWPAAHPVGAAKGRPQ